MFLHQPEKVPKIYRCVNLNMTDKRGMFLPEVRILRIPRSETRTLWHGLSREFLLGSELAGKGVPAINIPSSCLGSQCLGQPQEQHVSRVIQPGSLKFDLHIESQLQFCCMVECCEWLDPLIYERGLYTNIYMTRSEHERIRRSKAGMLQICTMSAENGYYVGHIYFSWDKLCFLIMTFLKWSMLLPIRAAYVLSDGIYDSQVFPNHPLATSPTIYEPKCSPHLLFSPSTTHSPPCLNELKGSLALELR